MSNDSKLEFSMVIASTVHDMKNSLVMLINAIRELEVKFEAIKHENAKEFSILQYEATRLNTGLVQLLGLYKLEEEQLPVNINYHYVEDFLPDQLTHHEPLIKANHIETIIDIEEGLEGYFDEDLIACIITNIMGNSIRYTKSKIKISAYEKESLILEIADDGQGYPSFMVEQQDSYIKNIEHATGSTGLGLYFAREIARLHKNNGKEGFITLFNGDPLGGGVFQLHLPI